MFKPCQPSERKVHVALSVMKKSEPGVVDAVDRASATDPREGTQTTRRVPRRRTNQTRVLSVVELDKPSPRSHSASLAILGCDLESSSDLPELARLSGLPVHDVDAIRVPRVVANYQHHQRARSAEFFRAEGLMQDFEATVDDADDLLHKPLKISNVDALSYACDAKSHLQVSIPQVSDTLRGCLDEFSAVSSSPLTASHRNTSPV